ncbi:MAG: hypothetical protein CMO01_30525 [Thalassobius sp.]|nr:hypothetical protein [Thalassovita sp.]
MNEFIINHILGIFITQLVLGIGSIVKLYFDFQTLRRDFLKKEVLDEKTHAKDEETIKVDLQKIETKIENNANQIEKFREEYRTDQQVLRDTITRLNLFHEILQDSIKKLELSLVKYKDV